MNLPVREGDEVVKMPDIVKVYGDGGSRVNATVIVGERGAVVVDTHVTLEDGKALKDMAGQASGGRPILAVILTHEHFDHIVGNQFFDCPIISTAAARESIVALSTDRLPEGFTPTPPTETFTGEMYIHLGDITLELRSDGGHSPGQLSVFIPEHGVLLTGDNVFNGRTPYVGDADVPRWLEVLTRLHAMGPEVVIPGHGQIGGKEILIQQRDWLEAFLGLAQDCFRKGIGVEEAADKVVAELKANPARRQVIAEGIRKICAKDGR
jgi:cyclase